MDRERWSPLNRQNLSRDQREVFYVCIGQTGPRGGKRPPLWEGYVYQWPGNYSEAVKDAEDDFLSGTTTTVRAG